MVVKIILDAGHNGATDPGAVYQRRRESDDNLRLTLAIGNLLSRAGYDVDYTRTGNLPQSVVQKAQLANATGADYFISIHRNMASYPGQYSGVQTLLYDLSGEKLTMAEAINENLEAIGFRNLGVEARPNLAVLRRTKMPALLLEVGFLDNESDNQLFDTRLDEIAQAIADGIIDTLNASSSRPPAAPPSEPDDSSKDERPLYRVQVGAFHNLQNAVALEQELKRMGYNTWIVTT